MPSTTLPRCNFVTLGEGALRGQQIHYRSAGTGPPLIALHPSPLSSAALIPVMSWLEAQATVIAPDTPGYGLSDALRTTGAGLKPYVDAVFAFARALNIERFGLYGSATGAQIAIECACAQPSAVRFLLLENVASFEDVEREAIVADYFPDLTPREDGANFATAWSMSRNLSLFFPWSWPTPESQLNNTPHMPLAAVHANTLCLLQSIDYSRAYRAAFANEKAERLQRVGVPTAVIRWQDSILKKYTDRLDRYSWGDNFEMVFCSAGLAARQHALRQAAQGMLQRFAPETQKIAPPKHDSGPRNTYAEAIRFISEARSDETATEPALVVIHDIGSSASTALQLLLGDADTASLLKNCHQLSAPDLPGHGASSAQTLDGNHSPQDYAHALSVALMSEDSPIDPKSARFTGIGLGGYIAMLLADQFANELPPLMIDPPLAVDPHAATDFSPQWGGEHLLRAWHAARDARLFWPPSQRDAQHMLVTPQTLDPNHIQRAALDLLTSNQVLASSWKAFACWQQNVQTPAKKVDDKRVELKFRALDPLATIRKQHALLPRT